MKNQQTYTITLGLSSSDQKLLNQIWRESQNILPTIESAIYKLALDGIRVQLDAQKEKNRAKFMDRKSGKTTESEAKPEAVVETQPTAKSEVNPEAVAEVQSTAQSSENAQ